MVHVDDGQCGLCKHFGEHAKKAAPELVKIRKTKEAPVELLEECGHPKHELLHLRVSPVSGCDGFEKMAA